MSCSRSPSRYWKLAPLGKAMCRVWITPLMLFSPAVFALPYIEYVDNASREIGEFYPAANWVLTNAGSLTANNAQTGWIDSQGSTLKLTGTTVDGNGTSGASIFLSGSNATIHTSIIRGGDIGLSVGLFGSQASDVSVTGSIISAASNALRMSAGNRVQIYGSELTASGPSGVGLQAFGGELNVANSRISGTLNGGLVRVAPTETDPLTLNLDNSHLIGETGAALVVRGSGLNQHGGSVINVLNGSTLRGGNGNLLEIDNSNAQMNVHSSELTGNVLVKNGGDAGLSLDQARMTGDVIAEAGSTARVALANGALLTGRLDNVASLNIDSAAQWTLVDDSTVASLAMDGGRVQMGDAGAFHTLSLGNLSGNGTFVMDADFAQSKVDFLEITGSATGNHSLLIGATGADPVDPSKLHVVHANAGDASFELLGGAVDVGTFRYELMQQGGKDWYLYETTRLTPSTEAVLALFNTAPTVWYGELSTLRSRMGELRFNGGQAGGWIRAYGNKYDAKSASNVGYQQTQHGVSFGADAPVPGGDGQWLVGLLGGFSQSDLDLGAGTSGKVNSYYVGAYGTWLDQDSGYYLDSVLKLNRLRNKADVAMSDGSRAKGDYHTNGIGASLEFGRHIKLDDGYFIEPYSQLSGVLMQGQDYRLDNGMRANGDQTRSLLGKLGATAGRNFDLGEGRIAQPYLRLAYAHEFASNNGVKVNGHRFNNDLSGSRGEVGAGIAVSMSERLQLHADFDYSNGDRLEQPWGANLGLRYSW